VQDFPPEIPFLRESVEFPVFLGLYVYIVVPMLHNDSFIERFEEHTMNVNDLLKGWGPTVLIGVGAALLAPVVIPLLGAAARPFAKGLVRGYLAITEQVREYSAELGEQFGDLVAEVQAERAAASAQAVAQVSPTEKTG
jgi:hypothetical protein